MRRAIISLAVATAGVMALASAASAAPTVQFKAKAVPIAGYPHTGNIFGAGAAFEHFDAIIVAEVFGKGLFRVERQSLSLERFDEAADLALPDGSG